MSIHSFFPTLKKDGSKLEIKRFFYLKWSKKYSPDFQAVWLSERPKDVNFIEEVKWDKLRKSHTFYLCGHFSDISEKKFFLQHEVKYKNIHNLKSHLQKNIRREDDIRAIPTAFHLLKMDPVELLRRLPIIMIEDVSLHESFTTLIWLMVSQSSTSFKMKKYMYEWLLGLVYVLCKIPNKDIIEYSDLSKEEKIIDLMDQYHSSLKEDQLSILYSMHLRIAYGGMEGDMEMFKQYAHTWYQRFQAENKEEEIKITVDRKKIRNINIYSVKALELDEWDLSAIDFHCSTKFIEFIQKRYSEMEEGEIKKMVWINSSSINHRIKHHVGYKTTEWNQMKNHVEKTQKYLLDSSF